jgi:hypothetical protein
MRHTWAGNVSWSKLSAGLGHLSEAAMALTFEPESIAYDRAQGLMRFFAADGVVLGPVDI